MEIIKFDLTKQGNKFKPMNSVNNGPIHFPGYRSQTTLENYKKMRAPYARTHDSSFAQMYGGRNIVDISLIFRNFDADPYDPNSYNFAGTDKFFNLIHSTGTKVFFRLGQSPDSALPDLGTSLPTDNLKWAIICEHIIRHYNEKWADGFELGIEYFEIWNEPDLESKKFTGLKGTDEEFFDFFATVLTYLKSKFPQYKFGGPAAVSSIEEYYVRFLKEMYSRSVPLDFFSWHIYPDYPEKMIKRGNRVREHLDKIGYTNTQSMVTEWNYIRDWNVHFPYSVKTIIGMKGAAFALAVMSLAQKSNIDMIHYYDIRPGGRFNGVFDFYTFEPLKTFYALCWYGKFYDFEKEISSENTVDNIYTLCGVKNGKTLTYVSYYTELDEEESNEKQIKLDFGKKGKYNVYLLDKTHDSELITTTEDTTFTLKANTCILVEEI